MENASIPEDLDTINLICRCGRHVQNWILYLPFAYPHGSTRFQNLLNFCFRCIRCIEVECHRFGPALVQWHDAPECIL